MKFPLFYRVFDKGTGVFQGVIHLSEGADSEYRGKKRISEHDFELVSGVHKEKKFS